MNRERFSLRETEYPAVRRVMGPDRERLDDDMLERRLEDLFPGAQAEDVENFMRTLQSFGRQVAPLAQRALPGVIQGATTGATVAGPWGALAGAVGGGAASLLSGGGRPAPRPGAPPAPRPAPPGPAPAPVAGPAPMVAPAEPIAPTPGAAGPMPALAPGLAPGVAPTLGTEPSAPAPPGAAPAATAQLMSVLSRPETLQALLALLMPGTGRSTVTVGAREVPAAAFANAIAETAALVAEAAGHPLEQSYSEYLFDGMGQPRGDLVNPSERAGLLLSDLAAVAAAEAMDEADESDESDESDEADEVAGAYGEAGEAESDPLDAYEDALRGIADGY